MQNSYLASSPSMATWIRSELPSGKLTAKAHGKSTILMVFTRKDGDFHGRAVSFKEGTVSSKRDVFFLGAAKNIDLINSY